VHGVGGGVGGGGFPHDGGGVGQLPQLQSDSQQDDFPPFDPPHLAALATPHASSCEVEVGCSQESCEVEAQVEVEGGFSHVSCEVEAQVEVEGGFSHVGGFSQLPVLGDDPQLLPSPLILGVAPLQLLLLLRDDPQLLSLILGVAPLQLLILLGDDPQLLSLILGVALVQLLLLLGDDPQLLSLILGVAPLQLLLLGDDPQLSPLILGATPQLSLLGVGDPQLISGAGVVQPSDNARLEPHSGFSH